MKTEAKIIADTTHCGHRITTFEVCVPLHTWVHILTHRMLSRNAQSNRGIPTKKLLERACYAPKVFPALCKGMSPKDAAADQLAAGDAWDAARRDAMFWARRLDSLGVHKEITNRILAPFMYVSGVITATEWDNFFALRCAHDTQDDTRDVACQMRDLRASHKPRSGTIHAPYTSLAEPENWSGLDRLRISAARCARVSYLGHDGKRDVEADKALAGKLWASGHHSPFEHPAVAWNGKSANFTGWKSLRHCDTEV